MDKIQATPRNKLGYLVDALRSVNGLAAQNEYTNMAANLVGTPAIERTLDRMSYGEPVTNIGKANVPIIPEDTGEAVMTLAPFAKPLAIAAETGVKAAPKIAARIADNAMAPSLLNKQQGVVKLPFDIDKTRFESAKDYLENISMPEMEQVRSYAKKMLREERVPKSFPGYDYELRKAITKLVEEKFK
jgi:hypothetical protein